MISLITKYLPEDYDLTKLSKELLEEIVLVNGSFSIISGSRDKNICIWDYRTGKLVKTLAKHVSDIVSIRISHDNLYIASCSKDNTIKIWCRITGKLIKNLECSNNVTDICFSFDDQKLISCGLNKIIEIRSMETFEIIHAIVTNTVDRMVQHISMIYDDQHIIYSDGHRKIIIHDIVTGNVNEIISAHDNDITGICCSLDNKWFTSRCWGRNIKIWNKSRSVHKTLVTNEQVLSANFSHDSSKIIAGSRYGKIMIWDVLTGDLIGTIDHGYWVSNVCFSHDDQIIIASFANDTMTMWNATTCEELKKNHCHSDGTTCLCSSHGNNNELVKKIKKLMININ
jgi:WD40 repeat protein